MVFVFSEKAKACSIYTKLAKMNFSNTGFTCQIHAIQTDLLHTSYFTIDCWVADGVITIGNQDTLLTLSNINVSLSGEIVLTMTKPVGLNSNVNALAIKEN